MVDWHFAKAQSWEEIVRVHDQFLCDYNEQNHWAHQFREDGRHSPAAVLGWVTRLRHRPEELQRAFFTVRFRRVLDSLGHVRIMRWRLYGEEGLARCEVALWLGAESLTVEYAGQAPSRYEIEYLSGTGKLREVKRPILFETSYALQQPRLFGLDTLGGEGWLKALRLEGYSPRRSQTSEVLQEALFPYHEAWA